MTLYDYNIDERLVEQFEWLHNLKEGDTVIVVTEDAWLKERIYHFGIIKSVDDQTLTLEGSNRIFSRSTGMHTTFSDNTHIVPGSLTLSEIGPKVIKNYHDTVEDLEIATKAFGSLWKSNRDMIDHRMQVFYDLSNRLLEILGFYSAKKRAKEPFT
jgi:hypothetical protein